MGKKIFTICFFILFLFPAKPYSLEDTNENFKTYDVVTYFLTTDKAVSLSWDEVQGAQFYEVELYHVERDQSEKAGETGKVESNMITFTLPRSGHFIPKIRACVENGEKICSTWSESTDSAIARVNGNNRAWWLYGYVAPPGKIDIGK